MMRNIIIIFLLLFLFNSNVSFSQNDSSHAHEEIKEVMATFMNCLINKDSTKFYSLFHTDPVVWVGIFKDKTQHHRFEKDGRNKNYFSSSYKKFYRSISEVGADEEKFYNVNIHADDGIASATFDYSFWENKKKINWGKESWGLVKINGQWKIVSVIFSLELENINPEPKN